MISTLAGNTGAFKKVASDSLLVDRQGVPASANPTPQL
jgi:hypothetical protein